MLFRLIPFVRGVDRPVLVRRGEQRPRRPGRCPLPRSRRPAAGGGAEEQGELGALSGLGAPARAGCQLAGDGEVVARPGHARDGEAGGGLVQGIGSYLMSSPSPGDRCPGRRLVRPTQDYKDAYFLGHSLPSAARNGKISGQCAISAAHARSLLVHLVRGLMASAGRGTGSTRSQAGLAGRSWLTAG